MTFPPLAGGRRNDESPRDDLRRSAWVLPNRPPVAGNASQFERIRTRDCHQGHLRQYAVAFANC